MTITRGPVRTAIKMLVYGPEGVGKTTFAAHVGGAVFIDTEGGTKHMDVARFDPPKTLEDAMEALECVKKDPEEFGAIVIDTVDWLEKLIFEAVCAEKKINNIEDLGYGKGYVYAKQKMQAILAALQEIADRGVHVVLVCHSIVRKFEQPDDMGAYDRYMLKLNEKNIAPIVKEWVDLMLFVNYKTDVIKGADGKTAKGRGGQKRVMYANHSACWDAKNRFGLPDEMPFDFEQIRHLFGGERKPVEAREIEREPEPEKKPMERKMPTATVEVGGTVPALPKEKPKKKGEKAPRPESMKSDDPGKDSLLETLWKLMQKSGVEDPLILQAVVAEKEYYDLTTQIRDYDSEFISDVLIEAWDQVNKLCQTKIFNLPF